jgi:hypothetical protein
LKLTNLQAALSPPLLWKHLPPVVRQNNGFDDIVFSREEFHLRGVQPLNDTSQQFFRRKMLVEQFLKASRASGRLMIFCLVFSAWKGHIQHRAKLDDRFFLQVCPTTNSRCRRIASETVAKRLVDVLSAIREEVQ